MLHTVFLIVIVVHHVLEMQGERVVKGVVSHGAFLGRRWFANKSVNEIGDFLQPDELAFKSGALFSGEVFLEPKVNVMEHG